MLNVVQNYLKMFEIRNVECLLADKKRAGHIRGPIHLAAGQEAVPLGLAPWLNSEDAVFGNHRSHHHFLAHGGTSLALISEVLGKAAGCSGGMGGSMHLALRDPLKFFSCPIVGGTVPLACGSALHQKLVAKTGISVAYFGDSAVEEGVVQEAFNFASLRRLPVLFVCENNFLGSHMHVTERQPSDEIIRFADAHRIEAIRCDGNDLEELMSIFESAVCEIRAGSGPKFVEALTFRHFGHVDWRTDVDVGLGRDQDALNAALERDPLKKLRASVLNTNDCELTIDSKCADIVARHNLEFEEAKGYPELNWTSVQRLSRG